MLFVISWCVLFDVFYLFGIVLLMFIDDFSFISARTMSDDVAFAFAEALKHNTSITTLDLFCLS